MLFYWYQSYHWYQWRPFLSPLTPMESICEYWTTLQKFCQTSTEVCNYPWKLFVSFLRQNLFLKLSGSAVLTVVSCTVLRRPPALPITVSNGPSLSFTYHPTFLQYVAYMSHFAVMGDLNWMHFINTQLSTAKAGVVVFYSRVFHIPCKS